MERLAVGGAILDVAADGWKTVNNLLMHSEGGTGMQGMTQKLREAVPEGIICFGEAENC